MPLKEIFTEICERLQSAGGVSKKFSNSKTDEERFAITYEVCNKHISNLNFQLITKSSEKSGKVRKTGNELFGKNEHWEALRFYNESIAYAPNESEELALAYGNRAACLLRLNFPKEALEDVERALKLPSTNEFKNKLVVREEKCLSGMDEKQENICMVKSGDLVPLSGETNSTLDSACDLVALFYDDYYERQLVAADDIKTGDVLIVEKPYASILLPDHFYTHCANCFKRSFNLIPCSRCSKAMFCNEKCKSKSAAYHEVECSILDVLVKLEAERMELLALRTVISASQQGLEKLYLETKEWDASKNNKNENNQVYKSLDYFNIYNLVTSSEKRTVSDLFYRSVVSVVLISLLEKYTNFFGPSGEDKKKFRMFCGGLVLRFLQSLPCNAHEVSEYCEDGLEEIGSGAFATLSLINHSCDPNVIRHSHGDAIVLRAIRPIKKGQQILDNYGYHYATHSFHERQNSLMKQYYFKCQCEACIQLWPIYEELPDKDLHFKKEVDMRVYKKLTEEFQKNLEKTLQGIFDVDVVKENLRYLDFLDEFVQRPWKDYNKCQEAIKHCLSFSANHFRFSKGVFS